VTNRRLAAAALLAAGTAALVALYATVGARGHEAHSHKLAALTQTVLPMEGGAPLELPALVGIDGAVFAPERFLGRRSIVFFGYMSCPDFCPTTLQLLNAVAADAASGIQAGTTQVVFVSVDPQRDTPARLKEYLAHFDPRFLGATGSREALERFAAAVGAAFQASASGFDHSTSFFVIDPQGRLAGVLLRPDDPARIVADLSRLKPALPAQAHGYRAP